MLTYLCRKFILIMCFSFEECNQKCEGLVLEAIGYHLKMSFLYGGTNSAKLSQSVKYHEEIRNFPNGKKTKFDLQSSLLRKYKEVYYLDRQVANSGGVSCDAVGRCLKVARAFFEKNGSLEFVEEDFFASEFVSRVISRERLSKLNSEDGSSLELPLQDLGQEENGSILSKLEEAYKKDTEGGATPLSNFVYSSKFECELMKASCQKTALLALFVGLFILLEKRIFRDQSWF